MSEERCELSDLPVKQCACRVHGPKPEPQPAQQGRPRFGPIQARYLGFCPNCKGKIEPGDLIMPTEDGYLCEECS